MEPFEAELKKALSGTAPIPAAEVAALNQQIVQSYARKQRRYRNLTWSYMAAAVVEMVILFALFFTISDLKLCLLFGIGILISFESTVLMKLWFWIMHNKISTLREIKQLQLQIAALGTREPPAQPAQPPFPAAGSTAVEEPPAAPGTWLWLAIGLGWLALLLATVFVVWPYATSSGVNAIPYFEQVVRPEMAQGPAGWQHTFEVTQPRRKFNVQVIPQDRTARIWLELTGENGGLLFRGAFDGYSNMYCGDGISPGRYSVALQYKQGGGECTLRISGVDKLPGTSPAGMALLMLCAAALFAIPLGILQHRYLRHIDSDTVGAGG